MNRLFTSLFLFLASSAAAATAQTTGLVNVNDLTINGFGSGSTSCNTVVINASGSQLFEPAMTTRLPGQPVAVFWSPCFCQPCSLLLPPTSSVCAIPYTACGSLSNQSIDLNILCPVAIGGSGITLNNSGTGIFNWSVVVPPNLRFSVQGIVIDACAGTTPPYIVTQAYDILTI